MSEPATSGVQRVLSWSVWRLAAAGLGIGAYFGLARFIVVEQQDLIAPACFAISAIVGVVAGFLGAAVFFIAGASGPSIDRIRREHGAHLNAALLGAIGGLLLAAMGAVVCGLFSNGYGAKAAICGLLMIVATETVFVGLALATSLRANLESPIPEREPYSRPGDHSASGQ